MQAGIELNEKLRLFFAVNLPKEVKEEIAQTLLPLIPAEKFRKVLQQNLHITMLFLGFMPREAANKIQEKVRELKQSEAFEAELNGVGHFKGRVLWIGIGKGSNEFSLLNKRLQKAIGVRGEKFHPHVTLARNRGMQKKETSALIEKLRAIGFRKKICVKSIELMQSKLQKSGPKYSIVFSLQFIGSRQQSSGEQLQDQSNSFE